MSRVFELLVPFACFVVVVVVVPMCSSLLECTFILAFVIENLPHNHKLFLYLFPKENLIFSLYLSSKDSIYIRLIVFFDNFVIYL